VIEVDLVSKRLQTMIRVRAKDKDGKPLKAEVFIDKNSVGMT
jgi:hypothetical protein